MQSTRRATFNAAVSGGAAAAARADLRRRRRRLRLRGLGRLRRDGVGILGRLRRLALRALLLGLALRRLLRPLLVELHAPLALFGLLQPKLGAEGPPRPRPDTGD